MKYRFDRSLCLSTRDGGITFDLSNVPMECKRFLTLVFLNFHGARVPRSILLSSDPASHIKSLYAFCDEFTFKSVMIRKDVDRSANWRGGNVVSVQDAVAFLSVKSIGTTFLCEPFNPLLNGYNISYSVIDGTRLIVEVAGPGFDASDLQRGDIRPHQVFIFDFESYGAELSQSVVDGKSYSDSRRARIAKIRRKYLDRSDIGLGSTFDEIDMHNLIPLKYVPLSKLSVVRKIERISALLRSSIVYFGRSFTISSSHVRVSEADDFVEVFWDVFVKSFVR